MLAKKKFVAERIQHRNRPISTATRHSGPPHQSHRAEITIAQKPQTNELNLEQIHISELAAPDLQPTDPTPSTNAQPVVDKQQQQQQQQQQEQTSEEISAAETTEAETRGAFSRALQFSSDEEHSSSDLVTSSDEEDDAESQSTEFAMYQMYIDEYAEVIYELYMKPPKWRIMYERTGRLDWKFRGETHLSVPLDDLRLSKLRFLDEPLRTRLNTKDATNQLLLAYLNKKARATGAAGLRLISSSTGADASQQQDSASDQKQQPRTSSSMY